MRRRSRAFPSPALPNALILEAGREPKLRTTVHGEIAEHGRARYGAVSLAPLVLTSWR